MSAVVSYDYRPVKVLTHYGGPDLPADMHTYMSEYEGEILPHIESMRTYLAESGHEFKLLNAKRYPGKTAKMIFCGGCASRYASMVPEAVRQRWLKSDVPYLAIPEGKVGPIFANDPWLMAALKHLDTENQLLIIYVAYDSNGYRWEQHEVRTYAHAEGSDALILENEVLLHSFCQATNFRMMRNQT